MVKNGLFFVFGLRRFFALLCLAAMSACGPGPVDRIDDPDSTDSLQARVRNLEDKGEIGRLLVLYGRHLDHRDFASFSALFSEREGEWIGGMGRAKGRDNIRSLMERTIGNPPADSAAAGFHIFTNENIEIDGDRASAETKWMFMMPDADGRPRPAYLGHYEDTFIREPEGWKFLRRAAYADIPKDAP